MHDKKHYRAWRYAKSLKPFILIQTSSRISMAIYWITGASSGIGKSLALELSRQGHSLILSARQAEKLKLLCS